MLTWLMPATGSLSSGGQSLPVRPHRGEGTGGQGAVPRGVSRLRRLHQPRNGKADAYAYLPNRGDQSDAGRVSACSKRCSTALPLWTLPSSYDWSRTHARPRGGEALERLARLEWPAASVVSVGRLCPGRHAASEDLTFRQPMRASGEVDRRSLTWLQSTPSRLSSTMVGESSR